MAAWKDPILEDWWPVAQSMILVRAPIPRVANAVCEEAESPCAIPQNDPPTAPIRAARFIRAVLAPECKDRRDQAAGSSQNHARCFTV